MANLTETATFDAAVYEVGVDDIVGPDSVGGVSNLQAQALADRTQFLKVRTDELEAARGASPTLNDRITAIESTADLEDGLTMLYAAQHFL